MGQTIEQYFINQRIEKVKELLVYDELSLTQIADSYGFSSIAHLSSQFKKVTGLTPSHFKELKKYRQRLPLDHIGIDEVFAEVLPNEKAQAVKRLQAQGHFVAMADDGVNDAPALAQANVGIAMGTGTDVAMQGAGVTLVKGDLLGIVRTINLSKATIRNIKQNLFFAFVYNAAGVPIAAGALYPVFGLLLSPMFAAGAMSLSAASVIANALRLKNVKV